jgi:sterol desaturase/sphingolipid hydroxylase (fatty acid hydroxylase superfamily)
VKGWLWRALSLNLLQAAMVYLAGVTWDPWLREAQVWSSRDWPVPLAALFGYVVLTFVYYFWHRARHEVDWLWKWVHQVHHSPQRIEIITSFYKHPLELLLNSILSSLVLYGLCGLSVTAATSAVLLSGLAELFYHWNIRTPAWLGPFFQRPESHCVHHELGRHTSNFADLPLWDILFRTYDNRPTFAGRCGFDDNREARLGAMLVGVDVNREPV